MSTRSIIARPEGDGFAGKYAHWDGYPTCRGAQLWESFAELGRDAQALRDYAIREGRQGYWSSYQTPTREIAELAKPEFIEGPCDLCGATGTRPDWAGTCGYEGCNGCDSTGTRRHTYGEGIRQQGWVPESQLNWVTSYGDDMGTEWAYVIADRALSVFERRWGSPENNEGHMTGMFGFGAGVDGGYWHLVGVFPWDGDEPNWEAVERGAYDTTALTAGEGS